MSVRRYRVRDMREAMRQVREHQGPDAVILSSRRVDGMLEVVASDESAPAVPASAALASATAPVDPELVAMRRELSDLRGLLLQQQAMSERDQWAARHPLAAELMQRLIQCGFAEKLARSLVGSIQEETPPAVAWSRLSARISASLATATPTVLEQGGMLALVGTTGVGKTTTLNRIALRQIRRMGADAVTLVTLDRQRLGAYKQLQSFGRMAGVPVMLLESEGDLVALSNRAGHGNLVLIDTEGLAARDAAERRRFAQVRKHLPLEIWLVIAATYQARVLNQILDAFQASTPAALVLTKVDEAEQLGETLSVLMEQPLGLAFYSDGQRIDEDLHRVDTQYLTGLALGESRRRPAMAARDEAREDKSIRLPEPPLCRVPATAQTRAPRESMVLESVVPFRKSLHAVQ